MGGDKDVQDTDQAEGPEEPLAAPLGPKVLQLLFKDSFGLLKRVKLIRRAQNDVRLMGLRSGADIRLQYLRRGWGCL